MTRAAVHVVLSQKGGVGKSTTAMNLAATTANAITGGDSNADSETALVSIDPQGSPLWWGNRIAEPPFAISQVGYDEVDQLSRLPQSKKIKQFFVDTPGWMGHDGAPDDPIAGLPFAEALHAVLRVATKVIVPIVPEGLTFDPTARTIKRLIQPYDLPYIVVINNWDPRDGEIDLKQTQEFVTAQGWPLAKTVIRRYKLHARAAVDGQVVTTYPRNRVGLECRQDFLNLAIELGIGGRR